MKGRLGLAKLTVLNQQEHRTLALLIVVEISTLIEKNYYKKRLSNENNDFDEYFAKRAEKDGYDILVTTMIEDYYVEKSFA